MIDQEKIDDLKRRMVHHTEIAGIAVCVLTAKELQELLEAITLLHKCREYLLEHIMTDPVAARLLDKICDLVEP